MKIKNILILSLILTSISCVKDVDIIPSSASETSQHKFPEGTRFDDIAIEIFEKLDIKILWTNVQNKDVNKSWISTGGDKEFGTLSEENAEKSIHFLNDHVFSKMNKELFFTVLKPNIYILYDFNSPAMVGFPMFGFYPIPYDLDGMDSWSFSLFGLSGDEAASKYPWYYPNTHKLPETDNDILKYRTGLFYKLFEKLIENGVIEIPQDFFDEFDYITEILYSESDADNENFYMNRGFCGFFNPVSAVFSPLRGSTPTNNFIYYMFLVAVHGRDAIINKEAGISNEDIKFGNYPLVIKYYDLVHNYMKDKYDYDLNQLHVYKLN